MKKYFTEIDKGSKAHDGSVITSHETLPFKLFAAVDKEQAWNHIDVLAALKIPPVRRVNVASSSGTLLQKRRLPREWLRASSIVYIFTKFKVDDV